MSEIIKVSHLKKYFKDVKAVDDISFSVEQGELFGFLGVNGAGKSTTINMLCTLFPPTEGDISICGLQMDKDSEKIKPHIGIVYQNNCLDKLLTVKENLWLRGGLYEKDKEKLKKRLHDVCEILSLTDVISRPFGKLSGGQKRRCEIARALLNTPDILFLDEPTTGLDPATRKNVWETVHLLQKEMKMTVFLTTHYMEEAATADHIAIMNKGHIVEFGTPFSLKEEYAKDKLIVVPKPGREPQIEACADSHRLKKKSREGRIVLTIDQTMDALPLLSELAEQIEGFEVIQGTMDDVFLNTVAE